MRGERDGERRAALRAEPPPATSPLRTLGLAGGFALAGAATLAVFLTDNPQYLRLAVLAAAWAFVVAAFLAGRRRADQQAVAGREEALRRRYEQELDREAAAHREYELELETQLRREAEESMRAELTALRGEVSELNLLRHEVARVARLGTDLPALSGLRADLAGLSALRDDLASLTALRDDVARLSALREDLASVGELKADVGRLRKDLAEQLNGEMLVERILLRTQATRLPGEAAADAVDPRSPRNWEDGRPPRGLTGGWPAVPLDEPREAPRPEPLVVERPTTAPSPQVPPASRRPAAQPPVPPSVPPLPAPAPATAAFPFASAAPWAAGAEPTPAPTPLEWLADRSLIEPTDLAAPHRSRHSTEQARPAAAPAPPRPVRLPGDVLAPLPPRRRRGDEPVDGRTEERPVAPATNVELARPSPAPRPSPFPRTAPQPSARAEAVPADGDGTDTAGHERLAQILAESGAQPPPGGRRRRRYRDEEQDADDVLARVLGRE
jgi:hypothetical protein